MKNRINTIVFMVYQYKQLLIATAILLGLIGDSPPGC